jgi:hypothetical protein
MVMDFLKRRSFLAEEGNIKNSVKMVLGQGIVRKSILYQIYNNGRFSGIRINANGEK